MAKRNKMLRKVLVTMCSAVLLVGATVGVTVAFLQDDTDVVTNTFTVGSVTIDLDEVKVDVYGEPLTGDDAGRGMANTYKLIPGHEYTKDPTVHVVEGSEECWVFVEVTNEISLIEDATTIATQMKENGWTLVDGETNVYKYETSVDARKGKEDLVVFETFKVKGDANVAAYEGETITVKAYAVQKDGFDTADKAWGATFGA